MDHDEFSNVQVLLVDDDQDDYLILKKTFSQIPETPFTLEWTASVREAKRLIKKSTHDIYLIDYQLGEYTGLDILKFAEPEKRAQPFILLTGAGNQAIEWRSVKLAASDYLVKGTFDANILSRTLYHALQRKKMEEQRMNHLIELNRSKDEFISIASHQLRTPATGVKQYLGMVLEGFVGDLNPTQQELLLKAYESNERQLRTVSDLLKVARVDSGKPLLKKSRVKVNGLIKDVIREQQHAFKSRHQTVVYTPLSPDVSIRVDSDSIRMVIENIVDNASKYSEDYTTITITVNESDSRISIHICDEGVGIKPEEESRLYQKFSRLDNSMSTKVGGTGLGLYLTKKIIDLHAGTITHKPNKGRGTMFIISLPK